MCIVHISYLLIQNCGRIVYTYVARSKICKDNRGIVGNYVCINPASLRSIIIHIYLDLQIFQKFTNLVNTYQSNM